MRPIRLIVAALLLMAVAAGPAVADDDGPIVGTPPLEDMLVDRVQDVWANPDYWENYVREAVVNGHLNLPWPFDAVKPEAFLPNVPVAPGEYASALPHRPIDLSDITYEWAGATRTVEQFLHTTQTDALVFVVDGAIAAEYYTNGYSPDVRHQPWSVTKTFVAAIVGIAADEGLIDSVHDPIDAYLPELAGTAWEGVTIENLLHMESGVHWDEGTPVLVVNTQVQQWVEVALDVHSGGALGMTRNEFLMSLPQVDEPGTQFSYNSGNTQVLAWLTEVLYDLPFNEVMSQKLWQPMGAAGDAVMISDRVGAVIASQGLYSRSHDLARFGELLRNGGRTPEGHQVVPADWVQAMVQMTEVSDGAYGYQTWAHLVAGPNAWSASGFQGQKITVVPDDCLTGVRLAHALGADLREGDDPFALDAYGFEVTTYEIEWQVMLRAIADAVGTCAAAVDPARDADAPGFAPDGAGTLPMPDTGGGLALLAVAVAALATTRRRGP